MLHPLKRMLRGYTSLGFSVGNLRVALLRAGLEYSEEIEPKETANFVVSKTESLLKNI